MVIGGNPIQNLSDLQEIYMAATNHALNYAKKLLTDEGRDIIINTF